MYMVWNKVRIGYRRTNKEIQTQAVTNELLKISLYLKLFQGITYIRPLRSEV